MDVLHAPWRENYITDTARDQKKLNKDECPFCMQVADNNDSEHMILKRYDHCFVVMNKFPYNGGHVLVLPLDHVASLQDLSDETRNELMKATAESDAILSKVLKNDGCNVGINLGKAAGAGIPTHLHIHVIPRWTGDTNFLPTVANVKQISSDTRKIYSDLKAEFSQ
jgi:ATP adenylyltransferase